MPGCLAVAIFCAFRIHIRFSKAAALKKTRQKEKQNPSNPIRLEGLHPVFLTLSGSRFLPASHGIGPSPGQVFWLPRPFGSLPVTMLRNSGVQRPKGFPACRFGWLNTAAATVLTAAFLSKRPVGSINNQTLCEGRVTAAGPLPNLTGFPIKRYADAPGPVSHTKRSLQCQAK